MDPRPLTPEDAAALLPLVRGLAEHHGDACRASEESLRQDLDDGWVWGFGLGDPLAGYVLAHTHMRVQFGERGVDLHHVYVRPEDRRRGYARALIASAEMEARRRGCDYAVISAVTDNAVARTAYEAQGYAWREARFWRFRKML